MFLVIERDIWHFLKLYLNNCVKYRHTPLMLPGFVLEPEWSSQHKENSWWIRECLFAKLLNQGNSWSYPEEPETLILQKPRDFRNREPVSRPWDETIDTIKWTTMAGCSSMEHRIEIWRLGMESKNIRWITFISFHKDCKWRSKR